MKNRVGKDERRERLADTQECWKKFVDKFFVAKENFLFPGRDEGGRIFSKDAIASAMKALAGAGEGKFNEVMPVAFADEDDSVKYLFSHAVFVYALIITDYKGVKVETKEKDINCLSLDGFAGSEKIYLKGCSSIGTHLKINKGKKSAIDYVLRFFKHLEEQPDLARASDFTESIKLFCEGEYKAQKGGIVDSMSSIILWYVAPKEYEPISAQDEKEDIAKSFAHLIKNNPSYSKDMLDNNFEINEVLRMIRQKLEAKRGEQISFYDADIEAEWRFRTYLRDIVKIDGGQYVIALKGQLSKIAISFGLIPAGSTFFDISDKTEFDQIKGALESNPEYSEPEEESHKTKTNALKRYGDFLAGRRGAEDDSDLSNDEDNAENGDNPMTETKQTPLNQIFYGPPGTGKTFHAIPAALEIIGGEAGFDELRKKGQIAMVTFHENFAYEEFIEGIKPVLNTGELSYQMEAGIFKEIAKKADESRQAGDGKNYVLIIDEINRGNLSRIFGELITLIESDKRLGQENELRLTLPYSKEDFGVPDNLYIIGTMNTADRSTTKLDTALRRRFHFVEMMPDPEKAAEHSSVPDVDCGKLLKAINRQICLWRDREHQIGHTYFMGLKSIDDLKDAFQDKIIPLLQEYFFADWGKIDLALNKNGFIVSEKAQADDEEMTLYEKLPSNDPAWTQAANYKKIYGEE